MTNKTTLNPVVAAGITGTFTRPTAFAKVAGVSGYQLGRMLEGQACDAVAVQRVVQAWAVLEPAALRQQIHVLSEQQTSDARVALGKVLAALDTTYEALTGVELIATSGGHKGHGAF